MSNYLAIATVTAALQKMLQATVQIDIDGARVTTVQPSRLGSGTPEKGVNLYLYQTTYNSVWKNSSDVRMRNRYEVGKRNITALDLHYMLSFYGNDAQLEPQRLLGSVIKILSDQPTLSKDILEETLADPTFSYLRESNLNEQVEEIHFSPLNLSLEDISKIWSTFFQTAYNLSIAYRASVVMIEGEISGTKALPVRERRLSIVPFFHQPVIDQIVPLRGKFDPIIVESILKIQGKNLASHSTQIRMGGIQITPEQVTDTEIILPLSRVPAQALRAGVQSLQVIHLQPASFFDNGKNLPATGTPTAGNTLQTPVLFSQTLESNPAPFVLRPTILKVSVSKLQGKEEEVRSAQIKIWVNLAIEKNQRVLLILNEKTLSNPAGYLFNAAPRRKDQTIITVPVHSIKPGEYLVRLQVDGAESLLNVDTNPDSRSFNQYNSPKIVIR